MIIKIRSYRIALMLLVVFALASNYLWLQKDFSIVGTDSPNHLIFSLDFYYSAHDLIHSRSLSLGQKLSRLILLFDEPGPNSEVYWPNGLNLTAAMFYSIFGISLLSAKLSLLPYLFILLVSTYMLGKKLFSEFAGLISTATLFMYPMIFQSSRQFQLDFPLTAIVTLSILFLLKCDYFKDRKYSFLSGLSAGYAMIVKGQAVIFLAVPVILVCYGSFLESRRTNASKQLVNMAIFLIVALLTASIWWGSQLDDALYSVVDHVISPAKAIESGYAFSEKYSYKNIIFHLRGLLRSALGPIPFCLFLISFLFFLIKQKGGYKWVLVNWIAAPFILFTFVFTIKHLRFMMPLLPAMALITGWGAFQLNKINRKLSLSVILPVIIFLIVQFNVFSSVNNPKIRNISIGNGHLFGRCIPEVSLGSEYEVFGQYRQDDGVDEVVKTIKDNSPAGRMITVGEINCAIASSLKLTYWLKLRSRYLEPLDFRYQTRKFYENLDHMDFILVVMPLDSSVECCSAPDFVNLVNNTGPCAASVPRLKRKFADFYEEMSKNLEKYRTDFMLVGKISTGIFSSDEKPVYYIYKKSRPRAPDRSSHS